MNTGTQEGTSGGRRVQGAKKAAFWLQEESLSALLVLVVALLFVLPVVNPAAGRPLSDVVFSLLLLSGVATVARRGWGRWVIGATVLLVLVLKWTGLAERGGPTRLVEAFASLASMTAFTLLVLTRTLSPGPITRRRVEGAVAAYLLFGVACGLGYELLETFRPGSLNVGSALAGWELRRVLEYFSLVTLTTVGYGDVTPVSPAARALSTFEGVVGQLYPAILIGWMISSLPSRRA
jgi:hypothetical protein